MCLFLFAYDVHPRYRLVAAANRDEFLRREAAQAHAWGDRAGTFAGLDREGGGTWMGVTQAGRFAALTNYRDAREVRSPSGGEPSRGALVRDYLSAQDGPAEHLAGVAAAGALYRGFNLVAGDVRELAYVSNRAEGVRRVERGVHGLSNHLLDTPWPKVERGKAALAALLEASGGREIDPEALLAIMTDETVAPDASLPDTGVGLAMERALSPVFLRMPGYGTRCSTALLVERSGLVTFVERTHAPEPRPDVRHPFRIAP